MKTSILKKSLLDYAIKGHLSAKWRREFHHCASPCHSKFHSCHSEGEARRILQDKESQPNAFDEINAYNAQILKDKKSKEKELKELESKLKTQKDKEAKQNLKSKITNLKKEIARFKIITPLNPPCDSAPTCHSKFHSCHSEGEARRILQDKESNGDISHFSNAQYDKDAFTPPFAIPPTWAWVRLGDIGEIFTGTTPKTTKVDNFGNFIPFLGPGDIDDMGNVCYDNKGLSQIGLQEARKIQVNSVLVTCIGGLIGKSCIVDRECTCNQQINIITPYSCVDFRILYYFINSQYFQILMQENSTGTATPIINKTLFENLLIPLPPLEEQKQIVRTLDSLITLADEFDRIKEELKRIEKRIEKSLLKYAIQGNLSKLFRTLHPATNAFNEIESYNKQILKDKEAKERELKSLEKTLKDFSKLTLETLEILCPTQTLESQECKTQEEKLKLQKDKAKQNLKSKITNLKKEIARFKIITPLFCDSAIKDSESQGIEKSIFQYKDNASTPPFAIPPTWAWVRLGDMVEINNGLQINLDLQTDKRARGLGDCKGDKGDASQVEPLVPLVKGKMLPILDVKYLRNDSDKNLTNSGNMVFTNERLILMDGENSGEIFIAKEDGFLGSTLKKLDFSAIVKIEFMDYILLHYKDFFKGNKKGAAIPHLDRHLFLNLQIPLPPLEEQKQIVQTLDTLFTLTKGLKCE